MFSITILLKIGDMMSEIRYNHKINSLQVLRAFAFLGILCQHCSLLRLGTWGVSIFFILSGFVLTYSSLVKKQSYALSVKEVLKFTYYRVKGLYPTHIATMCAMLGLGLYEMYVDGILNQWRKKLVHVVLSALLIQDWFKAEEIRCSLNGVAWYLSAMTFLYLMFPLLYKIIKKYKSNRHAFCVLAIMYFIQLVVTIFIVKVGKEVYYYTYFYPPYRCFDFFAGCNLGYLFYQESEKINLSSKGKSVCKIYDDLLILLGGVLVFVTIYVQWTVGSHLSWFNNSLLYLPSSCIIIYLFALNRGRLLAFMCKKPLLWVGNMSGYMFLIHQTVLYYSQAVCFKFCGGFKEHYLIQTIVVLIITVIATYIWIRICEKCNLKNRIQAR